jgi:hypothetical protein
VALKLAKTWASRRIKARHPSLLDHGEITISVNYALSVSFSRYANHALARTNGHPDTERMLPVEAAVIAIVAALTRCLVGVAWVIVAVRARREDLPAIGNALAQALPGRGKRRGATRA